MEFQRKIRTFNDLSYWKATEFRTFLLYVGPVVLQNILDKNAYENFCKLCYYMRILNSDTLLTETDLSFVQKQLENFVENFGKIYGEEFLSINLHSLLHIIEDIRNFGNVNNYSCFPFESFLSETKRFIKTGFLPLHQLKKRYVEYLRSDKEPLTHNSQLFTINLKKQHHTGPLLPSMNHDKYDQFYKLISTKFTINLQRKGNNCCTIQGGGVIIIENIVRNRQGQTFVIGKRYRTAELFNYGNSMCSKNVGIFILRKFGEYVNLNTAELESKCFLMPYHNTHCAVTLLHSIPDQ
jgi:hypothetical protein